MSAEIIIVENVEKSFGALKVLTGINLVVREGEFIVVLGVSGCGKSTLLRLIGGLERPTSGRITVHDNGVIGYIFQNFTLFPWRNVYRNIAIGLEIQGKPVEEIKSEVHRCIEQVNLGGFEHYFPYQLSGGMKQRVALARVLALKSKVILMDEPFNSLDSFSRQEMQQITRKMCKDFGLTVLFVTHDIDEAIRLADRLVFFDSQPPYILKEVNLRGGQYRDRDVNACKEDIFKLLRRNR
jgi:NitT/TauT family transport system ATP-binding protein